ncbi:hypothetical protein ACFTXM_47980 [Streptomyces sp. NPDC056930]|uniref:hypothetical protein n=1 Tax=Streptomyces sp. NPDC056930 TaxID=3345967 RepID=UPI003632426C
MTVVPRHRGRGPATPLRPVTDLATIVDRVVADGWTPVHRQNSTRRELVDHEWACWGALAS